MSTGSLKFLQESFHFQDLDDTGLLQLLRFHRQETYQPGQTILRQGTRPDGLYFILHGDVEISRSEKSGTFHIHTLSGGDIFGEAELWPSGRLAAVRHLSSVRRLATARTLSETTVLFWPMDPLLAFLQNHPPALERLKHASRSSWLAYQRHYSWLTEGETIHVLSRRHPVHLISGLLVPSILFLASIPLSLSGLQSQQTALLWIAIILGLMGMGWIIWRVIDYLNDFYILTNQRVIWLEKVAGLYERRQETPLQWVLSTGISSGVLGRFLDFGDIYIRTYTGQMVLTRVPSPQLVIDQMEERWHLIKQSQNEIDRDSMLQTIAERLAQSDAAPETGLPEFQPDHKTQINKGLDQWSFRTRFELEGVISYRKHWAVLLRDLFLPAALLTAVIVLVSLQVTGSLQVFSAERFFLFALPSIMIFSFWCVYRYVDWVNDIYQITPSQIVYIHKKPLGQEMRRVAPLENILGTEVSLKGIPGLVLKFGNVTAHVGTSEFTFTGVNNPNTVQQDIIRAQNAFLQQRSRNEQHQRQLEVVEWISAYHEETRSGQSENPNRSDPGNSLEEPRRESNHDHASSYDPGPGPAAEGPPGLPGDR